MRDGLSSNLLNVIVPQVKILQFLILAEALTKVLSLLTINFAVSQVEELEVYVYLEDRLQKLEVSWADLIVGDVKLKDSLSVRKSNGQMLKA